MEEMYRNRSMLKRSVLPGNVAEAAYFFAADLEFAFGLSCALTALIPTRVAR